jgi:thioredoxin reductase (NADPH)
MADVENVIIIGSGPAGYTAALYTARANLNPLVIEGFLWGGLLQQTTDVENYPGYPQGVMGPEMMQQFRDQAERFGTRFITDNVTKFEPGAEGEPHTVWIDDESYQARAVILAMGAAARHLGVPGEDKLLGMGVSTCATCDGFFFRDQDIAVVGGGDSAMEEATFLTRFARSVTLIHRRDEFRASRIMLERAKANEKIAFLLNTQVVEVEGDNRVTGVRVRNSATGEESTLSVTGVFVAIGHDPRSELVRGQVDVDADGYVVVRDHTTSTSIEGVFAAGDLVDHTYRQAITAAGTGCSAAIDAERWLAETATGTTQTTDTDLIGAQQ